MITIDKTQIFLGFGLFVFSWVLHLVIWKFSLVKKQLVALLLLFVLLPIFIALLYSISNPLPIAAILLALLLSVNYIAVYPALQASSPTLVILESLFRKKSMNESELIQLFSAEKLIEERIADLRNGGMIYIEQGVFRLSSKASLLARFFIVYRGILNLPQGAG